MMESDGSWKLLRFRKLGINIDNIEAEELWEILDADHSGEIDEDFWITETHSDISELHPRPVLVRIQEKIRERFNS